MSVGYFPLLGMSIVFVNFFEANGENAMIVYRLMIFKLHKPEHLTSDIPAFLFFIFLCSLFHCKS